MKRGKSVFLGVLLIGIILISVSFVSAGWLGDLFKVGEDKEIEGEEGELPALVGESDVQLMITEGGYDPPEIVWISDIVGPDEIPDNPVLSTDRDLLDGGDLVEKAKKEFRFYVYSPAGVNVLPGPGGPAITTSNVYVTLAYIGTTAHPDGPGLVTRKSFKCEHVEDASYDFANNLVDDCFGAGTECTFDDTDPDLPDSPANVRKYNCSVEINFYDNYNSVVDVDEWDIRAYVSDANTPSANQEGTEEDGTPHVNAVDQPSRATYWNQLTDFIITNPVSQALDFGSVVYNDNLDQRPTNGPLTLQNTGNIDVDTVELTAFDIPKTTETAPPTKFVYAAWFYTDPDDVDVCEPVPATQLQDSTAVDTGMADIAYGPAVTSDLLTCLDYLQNPIPPDNTPIGSYSTDDDTWTNGGIKWILGITPCANPGCV